jgi:rfaE bifunctional protein kinase chain/domain
MLSDSSLDRILSRIPSLTIGVVGDLFLDRYLEIDAALTEASIETGLDAYQVVRVRSNPGAAGTVINNLVALGVGHIHAMAAIGDDGEGYELRRALNESGVDARGVMLDRSRRTPTYTKPMLHEVGRQPRELNRLDIKNYSPLSAEAEEFALSALEKLWPRLDALLVLDQMDHRGNGVITERVARRLAELGQANANKLILADSRERVHMFRSVWLKPNQAECLRGARAVGASAETIEECAAHLARWAGRPVFCTCGERGIWVVDPRSATTRAIAVPAFPVTGPIDIVGAGDSTSAALGCAVAAGVGLEEAAAFGNLVASITIQQIGTTGTASPAQIKHRWEEVRKNTSATHTSPTH